MSVKVKCPHCASLTAGYYLDRSRCGKCHKSTAVQPEPSVSTSKRDRPPEQPVDHTHAEILRLERQLRDSRETSRILTKKLEATRKAEDLFINAADIIREHTVPLEPISFRPTASSEHATDCDMVLLLSDEHADQKISAAGTWGLERYDFNVFRCRLDRLKKMTVNYASRHLPAHRFNRMWVLKLGDSVNGDIHGAGPRNHFGNTIQAALSVGDAEAQFIQSLIPHFPGGVHTVSVAGNHPRRSMRKDYGGPNDNFDYLVATQIATRLAAESAEGRASVHVPNAWTCFVEIRDRIWALNHGDDVIGFAGIPWYGFERKNNRVQNLTARFNERVSYFCYGHFHTPMSFPSGGAKSFHSGAFPMTDPYVVNKPSEGKEPEQGLYVVDDPLGVILNVPVYIRDPKREALCLAGQYEPAVGNRLIIDDINVDRDVGEFALYRAPNAA